MRWLAFGAATAVGSAGPSAGYAQGIDCSKARSATEKAICASPELLALDHQVAVAFTGALKRSPDRRAAMRTDLLHWLKARDAACTLPAGQLGRCLDRQLTARLAALTPAETVPVPTAPVPAAMPPAVVVAATPVAPAQVVTAPPESPPEPRIPAGSPAAAAASIAPATLPAQPVAVSTLTVTSPGRFTLAAHSRSGVALQLVDMLTGPSEVSGDAGAEDGRLDVLLDTGTYRLRAFAAKGARDTVTLTVSPFHDAAPPQAAPSQGRVVTATLQDGEQRAYWLSVPDGKLPTIEAAGRGLGDLRLWRNGRDLAPLLPTATQPQPDPGHPVADLQLDGTVEPGTYLLVAYGGPPLAWTDGSGQPFALRVGLSDSLAGGLATGTIGPFGTERFAKPAFAGRVRLDLPVPADAALQVGDDTAALTTGSRTPGVALAATPGAGAVVEVHGREGQPYMLRATQAPGPQDLSTPGSYWVSAVTSGVGGDEVPPTLLLQHVAADDGSARPAPPRIIGSTAPVITSGQGWRRRFNLRGPTELILQNSTGGDLLVRADGLKLDRTAPASRYDVPGGYYGLTLQPADGGAGAVDVTVGSGSPAPLGAPLPPDPVIPFGLQTLSPGERLELLTQSAPDAATGLSARPVPVDLAAEPLFATQAAGDAALRIPVRLARGGTLAVRTLAGAPVAVQREVEASGAETVTVPPASSPRTIVLSSLPALPPAATIPPPPPQDTSTALSSGAPTAFDLREGEARSFALNLPTGGLYHVETLGRLHTRGRVSTRFLPRLAQDEADGPGGNMLIQSWLRAGSYRVAVTAIGSSGHGAVAATPAVLRQGAALLPNGRVHATVPAGTGIAFPLVITRAGRYRLELLSQGRPPIARLDDADGWPITRAGPMTDHEQDLQPGRYRLLISAAVVPSTVAARLLPVVAEAAILGHGPHALPAGVPQHATWREPAGRDAPRLPDIWSFTLEAPAAATIALEDGMEGTLIRPDGARLRVIATWQGQLKAGAYRLEAVSAGRNDRLDYSVGLSTEELQPGEARPITLPVTLPFSLSADRAVDIHSWGGTPIRAVLKRADGSELLRLGPRPDDWNLGLSRRLPAGSYRLELSAALPPDGASEVPQDPGLRPQPADEELAPDTAAAADDQGDAAVSPSDAAGGPDADNDPGASTDSATEQSSGDDNGAAAAPADAGRATDSSAPADDPDAAGPADTSVTVQLDLPPMLPAAPAPQLATSLDGTGVHVLTVPQPGVGEVLVADAASPGTSVLSLEREDASGWRTVAVSTGTAPRVAVTGDGGSAAWRLETWSVDGGNPSLRLAARVIDSAGASLRAVDGFAGPLAVARRRLPDRTPLRVDSAPDDMLVAAWPGHAAVPAGGQIVPQDDTLWLLAAAPAAPLLSPLAPAAGAAVSITVPGGGTVQLPASEAAGGHVRFWQVDSSMGQPGLVAGGVAPGSALAAADRTVALRNADGAAPLATQVRLLDLEMADPIRVDMPFHAELAPRTAQVVRLRGQPARLQAVLPAGTALLTAAGAAVWTGQAALSRDLVGVDGGMTLVNTTDRPASVSLLGGSSDTPDTLRPGMVFKRFFGAGGSFDLPVEAAPGARIAVAGDASLQWSGADGRVLRGRTISPGAAAGRLTVIHAQGAMVLSMALPGRSPWPTPAPGQLPADGHATLAGAAMAWRLDRASPTLLDVSTSAPVLLALGDAPPELFAAGAELHRAIPAGTSLLRAYSVDDGPLAGTLTLGTSPLRMLGNGVGPVTSVAPGGAALFGFSVAHDARIGIGVRAEPDLIRVRLLRADGTNVGAGVAQLHTLRAGSYLIEALVPADAPPVVLRPAVLGLDGPGSGPPPEIVQHFLELAGLKEPIP